MKRRIATLLAITFMLSIPAFAAGSKKTAPSTKEKPGTNMQIKTAEYEGIIIEATADRITVKTSNKKFVYDTIAFNLGKTTKYENCTKADLTAGAQVKVKHSLAMTKSLPPQAAAVSIKLMKKAERTFNYKGIITEIINGKDGKMIHVAADDNRSTYKVISFTVNTGTKLDNCKLDDLQIGAVVETTYGQMMTRSIPPITTAYSVKVIKAAASTSTSASASAQTFKYEGTIKETSNVRDNLMMLVTAKNPTENNPEIAFVVSKDTVLKNCKLEDLKTGAKVKLTYGMVMTMSLPPQTAALEIELQ